MAAHKQIVMTCDVPPRNLKNFEERLISRFEGGIVTEMETPSVETRLAILKMKASNYHRIIPPEILNFIAENISSHVRALEGALKRVVAFMDINDDMPMTVEAAKKLLHDQIQNEKAIKDISVENIQNVTSEYYSVTVKDILSDARPQNLVTPRQVAMFLARKLTPLPLQEIGNRFKKKHATIHHALKTIQDRLANEPKLRSEISEITVKLGRSPSDIFSDGGPDE
jgi:chromosomal replication initiator protein